MSEKHNKTRIESPSLIILRKEQEEQNISKYPIDTDSSIDKKEMQKYYNIGDFGFYSKIKENLSALSQMFNDVDADINTIQLETDSHDKSR